MDPRCPSLGNNSRHTRSHKHGHPTDGNKKRAIKIYQKIEQLRQTIPQIREIGTIQPRPGDKIKIPLSLTIEALEDM